MGLFRIFPFNKNEKRSFLKIAVYINLENIPLCAFPPFLVKNKIHSPHVYTNLPNLDCLLRDVFTVFIKT